MHTSIIYYIELILPKNTDTGFYIYTYKCKRPSAYRNDSQSNHGLMFSLKYNEFIQILIFGILKHNRKKIESLNIFKNF